MNTELIPRTTVLDIVRLRDNALVRYAEAHEAMVQAADAVALARSTAQEASPGVNSYNYHSDKDRVYFLKQDDVADRETFMDEARRLTDTDVWAHLIGITDLERLMDKKAKDEFRQQLITDPPEVTVDNVFATMQTLIGDADMIFKRGIAECFSNLDRRFRSHDGWKIGGRVILSNAFTNYGSWNHYQNHRDTLQDIERTFFVLEGKEQPANYGGIVGVVEANRGSGYGARQSEVESEYFKVRIFKNGNCHVWFKSKDLVRQVNKLLGEYYESRIPEEREAKDDPLSRPKTTLAKNYGFFPTPDDTAERVMDGAVPHDAKEEGCMVLEPSAGNGSLARLAVEAGATVDCVEMQSTLVADLQGQRIYRQITQGDFLAMKPKAELYDRVIMNPPFDRERDIDHVVHALKFLKPDGMLVAIMSAGTEFRTTKKSEAFRKLVIEELGGSLRDLPAGSFSSVGTNVNTLVLRVRKNGRPTYF